MATLGNKPQFGTYGFTRTQAESFNGDGSTVAFTLGHYVKNTYDIEVLVDNVQQSPFDGSYSVNGTTLTFSGAPSTGTNNIYVVYRQAGTTLDTQTLVPDDGTITTAKLGTITNMTVDRSITAGEAGDSSANHAALIVNSAGINPSQSAIAIQQGTFEGDTIIFADYEPYVEWGISTENGLDTIDFTSGNSTNGFATKSLMNRSGDNRTAHVKHRFHLIGGDMDIGGRIHSHNDNFGITRHYNPLSKDRKATYATSFTSQTNVTIDAVNTLGYPEGVKAIQVCAFWQIDGYGGSGGADHANCIFGQTTPSGSYYASTNNVGDVSGSFIMTHDGDGVTSWGTYGWWHNGIIEVNANGNIYGQLGNGYSGGTHYIRLQFYGWWQ